MKVKIQFEIDLSETQYNIGNEKELSESLQELGCWLHELHLHNLTSRIDSTFRNKDNKIMLEAADRHYKENIRLSEQIFNNYKVEGTMEDGKSFVFTHKEPGYKESIIIT